MANSDSQAQDRSQEGHEQELQNQQQINAEFTKAFQELARGERTASALESRLDGIESKIEQLLASVEENARQQGASKDPSNDKPDVKSTSRSK